MPRNPTVIQTDAPKPQFYRRVLPDTCISFSSREGKLIFREALLAGHMECYFKLAAQFRTQDEPAFCGLSTLVMVLNAMEIDPEQIWKGPWRWYHENMLDCCVPVKIIEKEGINFDQFVCLSECNGLETVPVRANEDATLEDFREIIVKYSQQDEKLVILSYSRKVLDQTGDGHFSPVGGYHPSRDLVLMLDTARFKYPPHWVPVPLLFKAMRACDTVTGKPRGCVLLTRQPKLYLPILFRISDTFDVTTNGPSSQRLSDLIQKWNAWLNQSCDDKDGIIAAAVCHLLEICGVNQTGICILTTLIDTKCCSGVSEEHICAIKTIIVEIKKDKIFQTVQETLNKSSNVSESLDIIGQTSVSVLECTSKYHCVERLEQAFFITLLILCWPYQAITPLTLGTNANYLNDMTCIFMNSSDKLYLCNEVRLLRKHLTVLLSRKGQCCY